MRTPKVGSLVNLTIGGRVRTRREEIGLTPDALANGLGIAPELLRQYEEGAASIPFELLAKLCTTLNVPALYFFEGLY